MERARTTFTFETRLGRGGYGEVYLATRTRPGGLSRKVAVKVLRKGISKETEALRRLRDEGRMLALLDHPAILGVLEMTRIDGRVALVTEYIHGIDAARCCKPGYLMPPRAVIGVIGEVAAALHTASTTVSPETGKPLNLIHRDIKPENIRVSKHGEVKLLDFGIARTNEIDREAQTVAGSLPFTPGYAAPECFNDGVQSPASDIFALGATAYRMLAGERLYQGMDTVQQLTTSSHPDRFNRYLQQRLARLTTSPEVVDLLQEMLAYEARDRPTAAQVQRRCEALTDRLTGPTHVRWARSTDFGEPHGIHDELTGRTFEADESVNADDVRTLKMDVPPGLSSLPPSSSPPSPRPHRLDPIDIASLPIPDSGLQTLPGGVKIAAHELPTQVQQRPGAEKPQGNGWLGLALKMSALAAVLGLLGGAALGLLVLWIWFQVG